MYPSKIKETTTITWHNLHFLLEYYSTEILSIVEAVINEGEKRTGSTEEKSEIEMLTDIKAEVIATVKRLKAMHTVVEHYRNITKETKR